MKRIEVIRSLEKLFFYGIILFLPTQFGKHFWPNFSYVSGLRIDYLSPTLYFTDVLIISLFFLWAAEKSSIFNLQFSIKSKVLKLNVFRIKNLFQIPNFKLKILLLLGLTAGIFFSRSPQAGIYGFVKLFEFVFFGFYTSKILKTKKDFLLVSLIFSFGVVFESLLSIAQFLSQSSINGVFYFFGERAISLQTSGAAIVSLNGSLFLRPYATFSHPNVLAGYLTIANAMVISNLKYQISNLKRVFFVLAISTGTFALFLTMSRVAIILWLGLVFLILFKTFRIKNLFQISNFKLKITLAVAIFLVLIFSPLRFRFFGTSLTDESVVDREKLIQASFEMFKRSPFFGVGLNNFIPNLPYVSKFTTESLFASLQPVHNIFFLIISETGMIGFGLFIWFLITTYQKIKNQKSKIKTTKKNLKFDISLILNSEFLILISLGMFDHYFLTLQQGQLLLSFVLGLCYSKLQDS